MNLLGTVFRSGGGDGSDDEGDVTVTAFLVRPFIAAASSDASSAGADSAETTCLVAIIITQPMTLPMMISLMLLAQLLLAPSALRRDRLELAVAAYVAVIQLLVDVIIARRRGQRLLTDAGDRLLHVDENAPRQIRRADVVETFIRTLARGLCRLRRLTSAGCSLIGFTLDNARRHRRRILLLHNCRLLLLLLLLLLMMMTVM